MKIFICVVLLASTVYGAPSFFDDIASSIGSIGKKVGDTFGQSVPKSDDTTTTDDTEKNLSPLVPQDVLSEANSKINGLKVDLTNVLPILDGVKNITSNILSNLKEHGPAEEIEKFINTATNHIDNTVKNNLNKILDSFSNIITDHFNAPSNVVNQLKACAKQLNKDVGITLPIKNYSKCITGPLKQIEDMVISIIQAIKDIEILATKIGTDGGKCLNNFNNLFTIGKAGSCLMELTTPVAGKASNIIASVTKTFMAVASFLPTLPSNAVACALKQTTSIIQTYAANNINGTVCGINGVLASI